MREERPPVTIDRLTCTVHHRMAPRATEALSGTPIGAALAETGRAVRHLVRRRPLGLPGAMLRLEDSPVDVLVLSVPPAATAAVAEALIRSARLDLPGHGSLLVQSAQEYSGASPRESFPDGPAEGPPAHPMLGDLSLLTCILSAPGSGQLVARVALELGAGVPIVTNGTGTGRRDSLGLLRITIPAEKEVARLIVPSGDAATVMRLLVEGAKLNRPGRGFIYQTDVKSALVDTRLRLGRQEHAASIEQIIAAIDELKRSTGWRRRFTDREIGDPLEPTSSTRLSEVSVVCTEERTPALLAAAMDAGAGGATTARVRRLSLTGSEVGTAARERSIIVVPTAREAAVVGALLDAGAVSDDPADVVQVVRCERTFSYSHSRTARSRTEP